MRLIGLSGKKRSGKDTLAARLIDAHGYTRLAFADAMRDMALEVDPLIYRDTHLAEYVQDLGWEDAKANPEVRRTLQRLGQAVRTVDPGFWVRITMAQASTVAGPVVITDVRMPDEAIAIEAAGGLLVRLERPGQAVDEHITETALDGWPFTVLVRNDATVAHLWTAADDLARSSL